MDKRTYLHQVDETLKRVQRWAEAFDPDELDYSTTDGVITLEFQDKTRYVLNRQTAANQMWFAAGARAWHYDWNDGRKQWLDDRDGHALLDNVARVVSEKLKRPLTIA